MPSWVRSSLSPPTRKKGRADLQGDKLHITGGGIFQVCLYPGQPDIPCAPTLLLSATLLKNSRITSSVIKSVVIWSTVFE